MEELQVRTVEHKSSTCILLQRDLQKREAFQLVSSYILKSKIFGRITVCIWTAIIMKFAVVTWPYTGS